MAAQIEFDRERLREVCRRWGISEFAFFGSVIRPDFASASDVDVLVSFKPGASRTLFDLVRIQEQLQDIFGRPVDLVERRVIESGENYIRRRHILEHTEPVNVA